MRQARRDGVNLAAARPGFLQRMEGLPEPMAPAADAAAARTLAAKLAALFRDRGAVLWWVRSFCGLAAPAYRPRNPVQPLHSPYTEPRNNKAQPCGPG